MFTLAFLALTTAQPETLPPGDHARTLMMREQKRTYIVHVPKGLDPQKPAPIVLALHGLGMNGPMMVWFSGLNKKADAAGFIAVYPSGASLSWNAGAFPLKSMVDDVAFIGKVLDDLATVVKVDESRVYACGMSNGATMCYRLAAEMSERIAAIAPVAGTVALDDNKPKRPVSVMHFHGTKDTLVPFELRPGKQFLKMKSVDASIKLWVKLDGCEEKPTTEVISKESDEMKVTRTTYRGGKEGSEVILIAIEGGGHTWPGMPPPTSLIGKSAMNISANDLIWEFFQRHRRK